MWILCGIFIDLTNLLKVSKNNLQSQGRSQGGERGEISPPETEKIVAENGVISEGSIFSNKFSNKKINK